MDAAVFHVLWCLVLQTSVNRCTQLVLDPLGNVKPVQFVVQLTEVNSISAKSTAGVAFVV